MNLITDAELTELEAAEAKATPGEWCAVIPPPGIDPDDYHYGYGQLRTMPTDEGRSGWSLVLMVDEFDERDADLEFVALARNQMPRLIQTILELRRQLASEVAR